MAEKDSTEKILLAYNDVFADIVNVLLFHGEEVVKPDKLAEQAPRSAYKADGRIREMERDVAKRWMNQNIRIACIGFENQTNVDPDMPLRILGYDGAEYRAELNGGQKERYPVVTLTLYFGYKKRWDKPTTLLECVDVPEKLRPYVNDYKINLFQIAYLEEEQVKKFQSDFGIVAEFFVKMRKGETDDYEKMQRQFDHVQETLQLLSVMTNDHRFEELCVDDSEMEVPKTMCEALDRIENRGREKGLSAGKELGLAAGKELGLAAGKELGLSAGKDMLATLMRMLFDAGRVADAEKASRDAAYRDQLLEEFHLTNI